MYHVSVYDRDYFQPHPYSLWENSKARRVYEDRGMTIVVSCCLPVGVLRPRS